MQHGKEGCHRHGAKQEPYDSVWWKKRSADPQKLYISRPQGTDTKKGIKQKKNQEKKEGKGKQTGKPFQNILPGHTPEKH